MLTTTLYRLTTTLPATLDQPSRDVIGMKPTMALIALVALAILVVSWYVGKARAKRNPPKPPVYPILDPPGGHRGGLDHPRAEPPRTDRTDDRRGKR